MSEKHVSGPAGAPWIVEGGGVERPLPCPDCKSCDCSAGVRQCEAAKEGDASAAAPPPAPSAELAALLPGLAEDLATARGVASVQLEGGGPREAVDRIARAAELLAAERDAERARVAELEAARATLPAEVAADLALLADPALPANQRASIAARVGEAWRAGGGTLDAERRVATYLARTALLATLGRQPVEVLRAVAEVVALRVEDVPASPREAVEKAIDIIEAEWHTSFAGPGDEPLLGAAWFACARRMFARIARVALAGIQACAPAPGRSVGPHCRHCSAALGAAHEEACVLRWKAVAEDEHETIVSAKACDTAPAGDAAKGGAT